MNCIFYINYLNHHQVALADEFYRNFGNQFTCICTRIVNNDELKGGKDYSSRAYCVNATNSIETHNYALQCAREADVCIFGAESIEYAVHRAKYNKTGLSFEVGERWFKKGFLNLFSPRFLRWLFSYYLYFNKSNFYRLCSSAFAARDVNCFGAYRKRCFKWGYFIDVDEARRVNSKDFNSLLSENKINIMWCARFLAWKHPELPIKLAYKLKQRGCRFVIDMFGVGEELEPIKKLAKKLKVEDVVCFCGNIPNDSILLEMSKHDVFLCTSDRNEGWGVVVNEAMAYGCVVIASNKVGSVPYLIKDGFNGAVFKSNDIYSLETKFLSVVSDSKQMKQLSQKAKATIIEQWSPQNAVLQFKKIVQAIVQNDSSLVPIDGPGSFTLNRR